MVIGGECRERLKAHPGYGCTMGEMCVGNSVCVNGKCACVDGKVEINKICIDQVSAKPGDTCGKGIICEGGSYCNTDSGKCACRRGENSINGVSYAFSGVEKVNVMFRSARVLLLSIQEISVRISHLDAREVLIVQEGDVNAHPE